MQPGEIHLAAFPFGDAPGMKLRPVLLLTPQIASANEVLVAYISSVIPPTVLPTDLVLDPQLEEHGQTGLKVTSVLRLHKLATIHVTTVRRRLGRLSAGFMDQTRASCGRSGGLREEPSTLAATRLTTAPIVRLACALIGQ